MSITLPMWFIYLCAITIVLNFINAIINFSRTKKALEKMPDKIAKLMTPEVIKSLSENMAIKVNDSLSNRLSDEYIVVKKPIRKVKKEEAENAQVH